MASGTISRLPPRHLPLWRSPRREYPAQPPNQGLRRHRRRGLLLPTSPPSMEVQCQPPLVEDNTMFVRFGIVLPLANCVHRTFMASSVSRRNLIRQLSTLSSTTSLHPLPSSSFPAIASISSSSSSSSSFLLHCLPASMRSRRTPVPFSIPRVFFTSSTSSPSDISEGPTSIDYRALLKEDEFHRLADETIHVLQERFEEYGDNIHMDGFDIDYGNQVLTLKLGALGTYVVNKQTPNRQIWLSSPVSGPSRFDWDRKSEAWVYRRTNANLLQLLEDEVTELCGKPISLS